MNTRQAQRAEIQACIKGVIEAIGKPVRLHEIQTHPLIAPKKLDNRAVGQHLRFMVQRKEIKRLTGKRWAPLKTRMAVTVPEQEKVAPKMYFVLIPSEQKILLDVGGMRLPVMIEE